MSLKVGLDTVFAFVVFVFVAFVVFVFVAFVVFVLLLLLLASIRSDRGLGPSSISLLFTLL